MSSHPSFIVVYKDGVSEEQINQQIEDLHSNGGKVTHRYGSFLKGFAADIPESFLNNLQGSHLIKYVEPNSKVTTQG